MKDRDAADAASEPILALQNDRSLRYKLLTVAACAQRNLLQPPNIIRTRDSGPSYLITGCILGSREANHATHFATVSERTFCCATLLRRRSRPDPGSRRSVHSSSATCRRSPACPGPAGHGSSRAAAGKTEGQQAGSARPERSRRAAGPVTPKNSKDDVEAIGNRNVGKGVNFYSLEKEIALGKGLAQEVERSSKLIDDPVVTEYVNRVGQNLVRNSDARVPFTIKVIDSDEVNAFALPGDFFYVNSGLILRAQEESELAGVMSHEIRTFVHGTNQATKGDIVQLVPFPP